MAIFRRGQTPEPMAWGDGCVRRVFGEGRDFDGRRIDWGGDGGGCEGSDENELHGNSETSSKCIQHWGLSYLPCPSGKHVITEGT